MLHASTWLGGGGGGFLAWRTLPGAEGHICHQHCHNANGRNAHLVGLLGGEACNGRSEVNYMAKHDVKARCLQHNLLMNLVMHFVMH